MLESNVVSALTKHVKKQNRRRKMFGLGLPEMIVVLVIALVFFGPSKLPSLGKGLGEAISGFRKGLAGEPAEDKKIEK
jgi:TatA/E family protein of Tat protein translocase